MLNWLYSFFVGNDVSLFEILIDIFIYDLLILGTNSLAKRNAQMKNKEYPIIDIKNIIKINYWTTSWCSLSKNSSTT